MTSFAKYDCKCSDCGAIIKAGWPIKFKEIKKSVFGGMCANSRQVGTGKYRVTCALCFSDERILKLEKQIANTEQMLAWEGSPDWQKAQDREDLENYYNELAYVYMVILGINENTVDKVDDLT